MKREGRCYELSGEKMMRAMLERVDGWEQMVLVHGTVGPNKNPHAWVEFEMEFEAIGIGGAQTRTFTVPVCWEPLFENEMPKDAFVRFMYAEEHARYVMPEMSKMIVRYKHWGPWPAGVGEEKAS